MKYISICSGIEAASTAWHSLGWQPLAFSEIEPFPSAVLAHHWPDAPNLGDMTKHNDWPTTLRPDLIVGGTPCQAFSVAGLRQGLADPRGNLTLVFLSILEQYRPTWVVWENVPGVLSDKTGAFGAFLGGLGQLGYGFAYRVLDAQYYGVAQRRRRVFVVAHLGDWRRAAAVLFERESLSGDSPPSRQKGEGVAAHTKGSSHWYGGPHSALNQSHNTGGIGMSNQELFSQQGAGLVQAIPARMTAFGEYVKDETAICMKQRDYKDATDLVAHCIPVQDGRDMQKAQNGLGVGSESDPAYTIDRTGAQAVAFQPGNLMRQGGADPSMQSFPTLTKGSGDQQPHVAFALDGYNQTLSETSQTIRSGKTDGDHVGMVLAPYAVRRLTPTECERLQGFPDGHTAIPWRNKTASECPDGPRYKALGNSMAVPVMRWIGERIKYVETL